LNTKLSRLLRSGTWTSRWPKQKGKIRLLNLRNGGRRLTTVTSYTRKQTKGGTTSKSRSSNSSEEIRYFSLTLTFVCLVMVSFVVSGKALSTACRGSLHSHTNDQCLKLFLEPNPQDFKEVDVLDFLEIE
jgi:hypothetical protein